MPALLMPSEILSMSAQAARRLVEAGEGDGALLYLALLSCGGGAPPAPPPPRRPQSRPRPPKGDPQL